MQEGIALAKRFTGVYTAIITPFTQDGKVDEKALENLIDRQINAGVAGIVPVGTTGESPTLSHEEHHFVIDLVIQMVNKRVAVIAGTGSNNTREAISLTQHAQKSGADASLQVAPYYNKPTQEGFYLHFKAIAENADIPLIIYNIAPRTAKNIETPTMVKLAQLKNIVGVKEASGDINQMMDVIRFTGDEFSVLAGDDNMILPLMAIGGDGVISVASNIVPDKLVSLVNAAQAKDYDQARSLHYELLPLFKAMFLETNPIPVKESLAMMGLVEPVFRLPMCNISSENKLRLQEILNQLKIV
jgi:4-hydroxy-tetrahydrodipicolinate synthase